MTKRKRIERILCLFVIWTAVGLMAYSLYVWDGEARILQTFDLLDSTPVEGCIEFNAPMNKVYLNREEKEKVLKDLARDLGLTGKYQTEEEKLDNQETIYLKKEGSAGSVSLSITTMYIALDDGKERIDQYLYVTYRSDKRLDTMLAYQEKIKKQLEKRDLTPVSNMNFKGQREGDLSVAEKNKLASRLFHYLKAEEVESIKNEEIYTVYGYSDLLKDSVSYGDNEINLNLAFSYEEEKDVTVFYLAMPYMRTDY
ncbi:MAG: YwmB family TATA-box binding protein [Lachnospiraceae bacterium]|nr:YwmB family TATA-box binding protein [Lachnospiraceae bacterium]